MSSISRSSISLNSSCEFLRIDYVPSKIKSIVLGLFEKIKQLFGYRSIDPKFKIEMDGVTCDIRQFMCKLLRNGGYRNPITKSETFTLDEYRPVFDWLNRQPRQIGFLDAVDKRVLDLILSKGEIKFYTSIRERAPLKRRFSFQAKVNRTNFFDIWRGSEYMYYPKFIALMIRMRIVPEIILSFDETFKKNKP